MTMLNNNDVAVVVCAYTEKRWDDTLAAIKSARNQEDGPPREVLLVIDHSDSLLKRAEEHYTNDDLVKVVANDHRQGLSGARNTGIDNTTAPVIAFLDDDAEARPGWLACLASAYTGDDVIGVGGSIDPVWVDTQRPIWWPREFDWVVGCTYKGMPETKAQIRNPIGANMSIRRTAFDGVGGFSSAIGRVGTRPVGAEETELFMRVARKFPGTKVVYEPSSSVDHKVPASRACWGYYIDRCYSEGLSKALVSQLGSSDGLSSEWTYTLKTLPLAVVTNLGKALHKDKGAGLRAGAIVVGLAVTTAGYIRGRLAKGPKPAPVPAPIDGTDA